MDRLCEHDMVRLKEDLIDGRYFDVVPKGTVGAVVHVYPPLEWQSPATNSVEVEFCEPEEFWCVERVYEDALERI